MTDSTDDAEDRMNRPLSDKDWGDGLYDKKSSTKEVEMKKSRTFFTHYDGGTFYVEVWKDRSWKLSMGYNSVQGIAEGPDILIPNRNKSHGEVLETLIYCRPPMKIIEFIKTLGVQLYKKEQWLT